MNDSTTADLANLVYTQTVLVSQFLHPPMPPLTGRIRACWRWPSPCSMPGSWPARPGLLDAPPARASPWAPKMGAIQPSVRFILPAVFRIGGKRATTANLKR
jgi:hypothetical protein